MREGGGEGREEKGGFLFSPPLPLPAPSISVALAPIFATPKSEKCLERAEKPTETLATQAIHVAMSCRHALSARAVEEM